jgi:hypothetical protein
LKEAAVKTSSPLLTADGINYLNIALMVISMCVAYIIPFELFLLAYAVLGPLHYLTEISWLQKKNFYMKSKSDIWPFAVITALILWGALNDHAKINNYTTGLMFTAFAFALIVLFVDKMTIKLGLLFAIFALFAAFGLNKVMPVVILFGLFLPTIIHVFLFTGVFMLYGALKAKSKSGIASVIIFLACASVFFIYQPATLWHATSTRVQETYRLFTILNEYLCRALSVGTIHTFDDFFTNPGAVAVMRFIAFAYTYHYLNWFSKTSVIKWHEISRTRMISILAVWVFSVAIYAYDYKDGFYWLFFLSILHVFLEFPLNHQSFMGVSKEVKALFVRK